MSIKFSIIGCGHIGTRHAQRILENPNAKLIGVFDIDAEKAESLAASCSVNSYTDLNTFLNADVDVICVCTPSGLHKEHAIMCLNAGRNVLVEKPMALSSFDCKEMLNSAKQNEKELFVVKQNRYNPPVQKMKEAIQSGVLGNVLQVSVNCFWNRNEEYYKQSEWKGTRQLDGGVLFNQFSHFIDIMYYFFGAIVNPVGKISNLMHQGITEFEDSGSFVFEFENGGFGSLNFTTNSHNKNMEGSITIFAEKGTVKIGGKYLNAIEYFNASEFTIEDLPVSAPANDYGFYEGSMSNHDKVIENVINTLNGTEQIMTTASDGLAVVNTIEQLYNSAKTI